jgi:hypothetical protein
MSATLSEAQWMVLSAASQRDDHCAMLPPRLRGGAAQKVRRASVAEGTTAPEPRSTGDEGPAPRRSMSGLWESDVGPDDPSPYAPKWVRNAHPANGARS